MATRKKAIPDDCMPKCQTCSFYQAENGEEHGACHRLPPVMVPEADYYDFAFPSVNLDDWCGEFKRKCN